MTKEHHANIQERIKELERFLGDSADKKAVASLQESHREHKATMETRLKFIESLVGDSADKHSQDIKDMKAQHKDLHFAVSSCAKTEHHAALAERLAYVEQLVGDNADKHADLVKKVGEKVSMQHHASVQ